MTDKNNWLKGMAILLLATIIGLVLCACGRTEEKADGDCIEITIVNTVEDRFKMMGASYNFGGETVGTTGVEVAGGGMLGRDDFSFYLYREDIGQGKDLKDLEFVVSVTEENGGTFEAARIMPGCQFGDRVRYELRYEDGSYSLRKVE